MKAFEGRTSRPSVGPDAALAHDPVPRRVAGAAPVLERQE
jgi:hypothetical protein